MIAARQRFVYALGDTGFNFVWQTIELYLLYFYLRVLHLDVPFAAMIFIWGGVVDIVADLWLGNRIDQRAVAMSLRRWMALSAPFLALALLLTFAMPVGEGGQTAWLALGAHLLLRVSYSLGNIPYAALPMRMSSKATDYIDLSASRMQGAALGGLIAGLIYWALPLNVRFAGQPLSVLLLAAGAVILVLTSAALVQEQRRQLATLKTASVGMFSPLVELVRQHASVRWLVLLVLVIGLAISVLHKSLLLLWADAGAERAGFVLALVPPLALLVLSPAWGAYARARGHRRAIRHALLLFAVGALILAMAAQGSVLAAAGFAVAAVAGGGLSVLFWALVARVGKEVEERDGRSAVRAVAVAGVARKVAQALAPQLLAFALSVSFIGLAGVVAGSALLAVGAGILALSNLAVTPIAQEM